MAYFHAPTGPHRQQADEGGQQHQRKADAVHAHRVADIERADPRQAKHPLHLRDGAPAEREPAGTCPAGPPRRSAGTPRDRVSHQLLQCEERQQAPPPPAKTPPNSARSRKGCPGRLIFEWVASPSMARSPTLFSAFANALRRIAKAIANALLWPKSGHKKSQTAQKCRWHSSFVRFVLFCINSVGVFSGGSQREPYLPYRATAKVAIKNRAMVPTTINTTYCRSRPVCTLRSAQPRGKNFHQP